MGDNRDAGRAPGGATAVQKKQGPAQDDAGAAVPEGAAADPGSALNSLAESHGANLMGMLQSSGGNSAALTEIDSLSRHADGAAQAKQEKDAFETMTDGQKMMKYTGDGGDGGGGAAKKGAKAAPPPGVPDPGAAAGFQAARASQLSSMATQYAGLANTLGVSAASPGLPPTMVEALAGAQAKAAEQQQALQQAAAKYGETAKLAGSEFQGAAVPGKSTMAAYQAAMAEQQQIASTLTSIGGDFSKAIGAEQAKIAEHDAKIAELMTKLKDAQDANQKAGGGDEKSSAPSGASPAGGSTQSMGSVQKKEGGGGKQPSKGGGGGAKSGGGAKGGATAKSSGKGGGGKGAKSSAKGGKDAKGGADAKSSAGSTGNTGLGSPDKGGADKKDLGDAAARGGTGAGAKAGGPPSKEGAAKKSSDGDQTAALAKEIEAAKKAKAAIEAEISASQGFINLIGALRDQYQNLAGQAGGGAQPPKG